LIGARNLRWLILHVQKAAYFMTIPVFVLQLATAFLALRALSKIAQKPGEERDNKDMAPLNDPTGDDATPYEDNKASP